MAGYRAVITLAIRAFNPFDPPTLHPCTQLTAQGNTCFGNRPSAANSGKLVEPSQAGKSRMTSRSFDEFHFFILGLIEHTKVNFSVIFFKTPPSAPEQERWRGDRLVTAGSNTDPPYQTSLRSPQGQNGQLYSEG